MTAVTVAQILRLAPDARPDLVAAIVDHWSEAEAAGVTKPARTRQFFSRLLVETGGLHAIEESLNYSVAGLRKNFGAHRISDAECQRLGRLGRRKADQPGIANVVYGGAWGATNLGNTEPGDGWRYRGGGMLQTTGRAGYRKMGFEDNPEALREPVTAFRTALREWVARGCNAMADRNDVVQICTAINGGTNGLAEQRAWLAKAVKIWPDEAAAGTSYPTLRRGDKGRAVKELQRQLAVAGLYAGRLDGDFGKITFDAVSELQRRRGLRIDGVAEPTTRSALSDLI